MYEYKVEIFPNKQVLMRFGNTIADQKVLISAITMGSIKAIAIQIGFDFMCNNNGFHGTLISSKNFN